MCTFTHMQEIISELVYSNVGKCGKEHLEGLMRLNQIFYIYF